MPLTSLALPPMPLKAEPQLLMMMMMMMATTNTTILIIKAITHKELAQASHFSGPIFGWLASWLAG